MNRVVALAMQVAVCVAFWVADYYYEDEYLFNGFLTFLALAIIYLIFKLILEENVVRRIKDSKVKYSVRKGVSIIYVLVFAAIVLGIWIRDSQALLVSFGIVGAGIAVALQDFFKNFAGGLVIFLTGLYRIGNRVEIDSHYGDVIDVGIMYTTLMELRGWVDGDQATGRLAIVPNGKILSTPVNNYSKDHNFIWDEIRLPLTYDSDWRHAAETITTMLETETKDVVSKASIELSRIMDKYYLTERVLHPSVFLTLTENWIELHVRYITDFRDRRVVHDKISRMIIEFVSKSERLRIGSETISVSEFPGAVAAPETPGKAVRKTKR